jgi:hypothetical protein
MLTAKRTLVKSGPELWAEISDPEALGTHFAAFGDIRIIRVADASLVEWEGERAAGRLELAPSGFGTRVELSAEVARVAAPPIALPPPTEPEPEPVVRDPEPEPKRGFWARFRRPRPEPAPVAAAPPPPPPAPRTEAAMPEDDALAVLTATLDALG